MWDHLHTCPSLTKYVPEEQLQAEEDRGSFRWDWLVPFLEDPRPLCSSQIVAESERQPFVRYLPFIQNRSPTSDALSELRWLAHRLFPRRHLNRVIVVSAYANLSDKILHEEFIASGNDSD